MLRYSFFIMIILFTVNSSTGASEIGPLNVKFNTPYPYDNDRTMVKTYLNVINILRSKPRRCGNKGTFKATVPLKWSDKLYRAASEHAYDMATHNLLNHYGSGKATDITGRRKGHASKASERGKFHGYTYSKAFAFAENIGAGQKNLSEIVKAWMNSPSHCANIMNPNFREMALAKSTNPNTRYKTYWTLDLGYRR